MEHAGVEPQICGSVFYGNSPVPSLTEFRSHTSGVFGLVGIPPDSVIYDRIQAEADELINALRDLYRRLTDKRVKRDVKEIIESVTLIVKDLMMLAAKEAYRLWRRLKRALKALIRDLKRRIRRRRRSR